MMMMISLIEMYRPIMEHGVGPTENKNKSIMQSLCTYLGLMRRRLRWVFCKSRLEEQLIKYLKLTRRSRKVGILMFGRQLLNI